MALQAARKETGMYAPQFLEALAAERRQDDLRWAARERQVATLRAAQRLEREAAAQARIHVEPAPARGKPVADTDGICRPSAVADAHHV
jgi:hypothetical protein